jgi:hypothetical protein
MATLGNAHCFDTITLTKGSADQEVDRLENPRKNGLTRCATMFALTSPALLSQIWERRELEQSSGSLLPSLGEGLGMRAMQD